MIDRNSVYGQKAWDKKGWLSANIIRIFRANKYRFDPGEVPHFKTFLMNMEIGALEDLCVSMLKFNDMEVVLKLIKKNE